MHEHHEHHEHGAHGNNEHIDPVCGMTVVMDQTSRPYEYNGATYYFCSAGCHDAFAKDPTAHISKEAKC